VNTWIAFVLPQWIFVQEKTSYVETGVPPSHESSNNPLAVKPETENDARRLNFFRKHIRDFNSIEAAIPSATKELRK
jgi:hypothetical protein